MLPTKPTFEHHQQRNKENLDHIALEKSTDDDAESSHSDCRILESSPLTFTDSTSHRGVLPESLSKHTKLLIIYEDRIMDVHLLATVLNLARQQRLTISHLNHLYSIPKRHLYLSTACDHQQISIPERNRIMYIPSSTSGKKFSLGFIGESPSVYNHSRHLILLDDGSAVYGQATDSIHLCLCQDFEQNVRSMDSKSIRETVADFFARSHPKKNTFQLQQYVRVKKFDENYHNAQVIDLDCSMIKVKFYERQAQTEIWIHQQSSLIVEANMTLVEIASPMISENKRKFEQICNAAHIPKHSSPSSSYKLHQCSPQCVETAEVNFNPTSITQNPYTLPSLCGWKFLHATRHAKSRFTKKPSTRKNNSSRSTYLYRSPCGRSFLSLDEVQDYLLQTKSKLTIKFFVDDRSTHLRSCLQYYYGHIRLEDLAQGREYVRIPVYNEKNSNLPEPFLYGTETRSKLILPNNLTTTSNTCCSCTDNCRDRLKCPCWLKTFEQAKINDNEQILQWQRQNLSDEQMISRFAYVHQRLKAPVWSGIYECNSQCSCHTRHCPNRLVQSGLYQQLQLFHTERKGWAIRVLHDIPHGSFINAYVGELITEEIAMKRDFKYLAILDHKSHLYPTDNKKRKQLTKTTFSPRRLTDGGTTRKQIKSCVRLSTDSRNDCDDDDDDDEEEEEEEENDSCFILDAKHYGSISRFYNHSCNPNVHIQNVFINSHDPRFPVIALFACRLIRAGEEICWDYNYTVGCMPDVRIECQCQSAHCRGRLL